MLGACSKQVGGQVVAVVNNEEVTRQELQAEAEAARVPATADKHTATVALLQRVVDRTLLADYAHQQGLDRGPEFVARRRFLEQTLLAELALRKLAGTQPEPTQAEVQAFIAAHPTMFSQRQQLTLDQVQFPVLADTKQFQSIAKLPTMDAVVQQLKAAGIAYKRGTPVVDTGALEPSVASQIINLRNGEVFDISTGGVSFISVITARSTAATQPAAWAATATEAIRRERSGKTLEASMAKLRKDAKIEYDPALKPKGA
ncbi:hypothetical protein U1872_00675 [Sphingomonas sp. RB3P16]|uniref:peptidyl-prolyl cis-trans isomerase n=1 Tax=Parasphingomonas frigoris TaxID=3096163 RepID=UPI002FC6643D